jgi:hypothetical protein
MSCYAFDLWITDSAAYVLLKHVPKYCPINPIRSEFCMKKHWDFCMRPHAKGTLQVGEFVKNPFRS